VKHLTYESPDKDYSAETKSADEGEINSLLLEALAEAVLLPAINLTIGFIIKTYFCNL
jgi:hypothetical protein